MSLRGEDMDPEQQQLLIDRYPSLLDIESGPWGPGMGFTVRVGASGWFHLIDELCRKIVHINSRSRITEIKEKLGELRIVCHVADERIIALIRRARMKSAHTCQVCGARGTLHILPGGLAATLCEADAKQLRTTGNRSTRTSSPLLIR